MVVPVKHLSKSRSRKRRAQKGIKKLPELQKCKNCSNFKMPHRICDKCGFYRGRFYLFGKEKKQKKK